MNSEIQNTLDRTVTALRNTLGDNLCSCCVYGSAVRGNTIEGVSDINLLIVLQQSSPAAHDAVAEALAGQPKIDPFILARRGFERSVRAFVTKFQSIRRHYRLLHGEDLLANINVDPLFERLVCEQGVRNLRLRLVYAYVRHTQERGYDRFLVRHVTPMFVQFSEVLRLSGVEVPKEFAERVALMEREFGPEAVVMRDLLALKAKPRRLDQTAAQEWHHRVFPFVDKVLVWLETRWK